MALATANLDLSDVNIVNGLNNAQLPGRMQVINQQPIILLDVAHNPHSAQYLVERVKQKFDGKTVHTVVAMLHDKDIKATLQELSEIASNWYPASLTGPRAASADELCQYLPESNQKYRSPVEAFNAAMTNAQTEDVILVVGSFHTVGEVLEYWQSKGA